MSMLKLVRVGENGVNKVNRLRKVDRTSVVLNGHDIWGDIEFRGKSKWEEVVRMRTANVN